MSFTSEARHVVYIGRIVSVYPTNRVVVSSPSELQRDLMASRLDDWLADNGLAIQGRLLAGTQPAAVVNLPATITSAQQGRQQQASPTGNVNYHAGVRNDATVHCTLNI